VSSLFAHALHCCSMYFVSNVGVISCDCVTCTCLSVALYNCHRVETHLQLKPMIIILHLPIDLFELGSQD
jgi:hypothetical protein